jgi:tetratricopeptide (TPR) repeat protein
VVLQHKGLYDDALECYEKSLAIAEAVHVPIHEATAKCDKNIGSILLIRRETERALEMYQKDLATCELVHGKDHAETGKAHKNIGWVLFHLESYELALDHCRTALAIQVAVLGPELPDVTSTGRLFALTRDAMTNEEP